MRELKDRRIPFVDDGIKDIKDNTYDGLQQFYKRCHVGEYINITEKGKFLKFEFGKILDRYRTWDKEDEENETLRKLSYIEINKKSFMHNMNTSARYINYFIEYFDDDDELMLSYFNMMFMIMYSEVDLDPISFAENIWAQFSTDSMTKKVIDMVEYNTDESLIKKSDRKYDESIQLTTEHLKAIMAVSCLHKFVIPIVSQYYNVKKNRLEEAGWSDKDLYFYVFSGFIPVFDSHYDISLYDKLYHTATTRVSKTENGDSTMWKRRKRLGTTPTGFTNKLMRDFLIDISQKVVFSQSAIVFIHVCFDHAISTELIQRDQFEFSDMKMEASDSVNETISRFDRWQTDKAFHNQRDRLRAMVSIEDIIIRCGDEYGFDFEKLNSKKKKHIKEIAATRKEFEFYRDNLPQPLTEAQMYIIYLYCSAKLESTEDAKQIESDDLFKIIMIMKRDFALRNFSYLQFFISGKVDTTANRRYNKRRVEKLFSNHPCYDDFVNEYEDTSSLLNMDKVLNNLKVILSCPIKTVDYNFPGLNDKTLTPTDACVVDEFMRFLLDI